MIRFLLLFLCVNILSAQDETISIRSYTLEDGLSHNQINWLHKDSRGMLWVGTFNGINRYDGQAFKHVVEVDFAHVDNENILEDEEGDLWLIKNRAKNELFFFNTISEKIKTFEEKFGAHPPFKKSEFLSATKLADQTLVIGTNTGKLITIATNQPAKTQQILDEGKVQVFSNKNSNQFWAYTTGSIDEVTKGQLILYNDNKIPKVMDDSVQSFYKYIGTTKKNHFLFGTGDKNITELTPDGKLRKYKVDLDDIAIWTNKYREFTYDANQNCLLTCHKGKVRKKALDKKEPQSTYQYHKELDVTGIYFSLLEGDNYWIGTINGLIKIQLKSQPFKQAFKKDPKQTPQKDFMSCRGISEDNKGNTVIAMDGLYEMNGNRQLIYNRNNSPFHSVFHDANDNIWLGFQNGVERIDAVTKEITTFRAPGNYYRDWVWSFFETSKGEILTASEHGILYYKDGFSTLKDFDKTYDPSSSERIIVYQFFEDKDQQVWLPTSKGLQQIDLEKRRVSQFVPNKNTPYLSKNLRHIHQDKAGVFWIASNEGLIKWNKENNELRLFTTKDGLSNNNLYAVYEDDFGFLWMSSDYGIMQFQKSTSIVKTYLQSDGITHQEFNRISHLQSKDGTLYFGGLNGVTYFNPKDFVALFKQPLDIPLILTECKIFSGKEGKQENRFSDYHNTGKIVLAPNDRYLMLQFALLDYYHAKAPQYVYQIDGETFGTSKENAINISALPYGKHSLTVKARTGNGLFSSQTLSIPIEVLRPFYLQWWFIGISILALAGIIAFYQKMKTQRLLQRQEDLEKTVAERTQTIQQQSEELLELDKAKSRFLANISHELRTPLTLILNTLNDDQIEKVISRQDEITKLAFEQTDVNIMQRNARRLQQLIDQLLDLSKLEAGKMTLKASKSDFRTYFQEIVNTFQSIAQRKNIQLTIEAPNQELPLYFERDKMDKIGYNLLSNAIKFTPEGGHVNVRLWQTATALLFSISDTGIGIPKVDLNHIFNRFYQVKRKDEFAYEGTGLGLALVKELVEIHYGTVHVSNNNDHGACFTIALPLGSDHLKPEEKVIHQSFVQHNGIQKIGEQELNIPAKDQTETILTDDRPILLVIEDNKDLLHYHQKVFGSNYQVFLTQNGNEGIAKAFEIIPDIIICDVMMPEKNGYEVCQILKTDERTNHIPLILLTAKTAHEEKMEGLIAGADDYMTKPYDQHELKLRIHNLLVHVGHLQKQFSQEKEGIINKAIETPQEKFIQKTYQIIEENYANRYFGVTELSEALSMSRSQLFRKVKAISGNTPNNILRTYRLNRAKELLIQEDGNATNVSYLVGFNNPNYFFKCFKDEFALTPKQYMEQVYNKQN